MADKLFTYFALVAEETTIRQVGEGSDRVLVAEKNSMVTVEVEPGVHVMRMTKQTAVVTAQNEVPQIQTGNLRPALPSSSGNVPVRPPPDRSCCDQCFHCDQDEWYKCTGKGPGWIPLYILFYLIMGSVGLVLLICVCLCICAFGGNSNNDD